MDPRFDTFDELRQLVTNEDGLVLTDMEALRDAHGVGKLGVHVRAAIHERLESYGLGPCHTTFPATNMRKFASTNLGRISPRS